MRKIMIIILLFICASKCEAQINYLFNPSFEQYTHCPAIFDEIKYANYWSPISDTLLTATDTFANPNCTPEYCNTCATNPNVSVPLNYRFNHSPRTGNGMAQVVMYYNNGDASELYQRDYLQGRLKQTLEVGRQYCVSFYVLFEPSSAYAVNDIGAYFDNGIIDTTNHCGLPEVTHVPQVLETSIITNTVNWTKIQGTFIASGNEKFITIGNFFDDNHIDTISTTSSIGNLYWSWYLVDDISIIEVDSVADAGRDTTILAGDTAWIGNHDDYLPCKWYMATTGALIDSNHAGLAVHPSMTTSYVMELDVCGVLSYDTVTVTIHPTASPNLSKGEGPLNCVMSPNPTRDNITVSGLQETCSYKLMNSVGQTVLSGRFEQLNNTISLFGLPQGMYVLAVIGADGSHANFKVEKE